MKKLQSSLLLLFLFFAVTAFAQRPEGQGGKPGGQGGPKVKVTGKLIEQDTKQPLEFANIIIQTTSNVTVNGGLTDAKGEFSLEVPAGTYNIKYDFISFKTVVISNKIITEDTNLGTTAMASDATQLSEIAITAERSTVEIKLDKRVYTVGNDMMVKGGTVSDVLDNVPSVSVDAEGNVALRGNQSVTILIDGRPSTMAGSNVAEVLRLLPADSVDKVEVITNPSARYDAEGGGGIINIVLKKGKADGFNGSVVATTGDPANHGVSTNLNFRSENFNIFSNIGYNYRKNPGNSMNNTKYLNEDNSAKSYTDEKRENVREREGYNASFGLEYFLTKKTTWTNSVNIRRNTGGNDTDTYYQNYDADHVFTSTRYRNNNEDTNETNVNYSTNLIHKFNDKGHELKIDGSISMSKDDNLSGISNTTLGSDTTTYQRTLNNQEENRSLLQADYVLPIGQNSKFEAGYRGSFSTLDNDARAENLVDGNWANDPNYSNYLEYKEKVNALYTQFGSKAGKFSYLLGLRWEDSNIDVNLLSTGEYNNKNYNNFFPSAFLTYEFNQNTNASINYSRRINRPRGRFLNPFSGLESNINIFKGNPDLNPSYTNAIDLGFLKKWSQLTLSSSAYVNLTDAPFQFIRRLNGLYVEDTPVIITSPTNIGKEFRFGFEFNVNYNPFKWWRINSNFNFYRNQTDGDYSYSYFDQKTQQTVNAYLDLNSSGASWTTRINSKISLPYKIDWQLNGNYEAPQNTSQGRRVGVASANTSFSKDVLKDKGTIGLSIQDIFNSRKMKFETFINGESSSYSEMQWRQRQVTLSFTYRFNMNKNDKQQQQRQQQDGGGEEYMGG
ncbi:TonB-dependent receptor domain-containing protein [Flavobacterium sp. AG291]|uniref:TonB-dependent receptor domain-containing protein n=1 Tax=Flavobacterium sp. AG291 TaxID=2184000 RepID=UPI000E0C8EA8|nr:TonB-dependent receptor [Flavobacterium sp. AG291]RDI13285.1 outer membrane receptor protein involved in Fe transport [Flavobacterium sp. AG291]